MPEQQNDDPPPDDEAAGPEAPKKPDLRVSTHQDLGVNVSRDLNAGGWLARGDRSNMSKLRFSVQAKPRDELDPELQALREPGPPKPAAASSAPDPGTANASASPAGTGGPSSAPPTSDEKSEGLLGRISRLLGGD